MTSISPLAGNPGRTRKIMNPVLFEQLLTWSAALRRKVNLDPAFIPWLQAQYQQPIHPDELTRWYEQDLHKGQQLFPQATQEQIKFALRLLRDRVFYLQYAREASALATPVETGRIMSSLAEYVVRICYEYLYQQLGEAHGLPLHPQTSEPLDMLLVAMGKWGGQELNVSSDIDFIPLYEFEGETTGRRPLSYQEFYTRLTQRLQSMLSQPTAQGIVFRTDLRLRPDGDSGPLVWSLAGLHRYFIQQGREWERYAWIKARPVFLRQTAYLQQSAQRLENIKQAFVYKKYFDFDTMLPLRALRAQIHEDWQQKARQRATVKDSLNIKLGEGSIREIEFVVQLTQLIRGGHSPSLQHTNLHAALQAQLRARLLRPELARELAQNYDFLRKIEHFLQFKEDEQTHLLPDDPAEMDLLAQLMGQQPQDFEQELTVRRQQIRLAFDNAFKIAGLQQHDPSPHDARVAAPPSPTAPTSQALLQEWQRLETHFFQTQRAQRLTTQQQDRIHNLSSQIKKILAHNDYPKALAPRFWGLIEEIALRSAYTSLLALHPEILQRLCNILAASPWAAQYLTHYPIVLNRLIHWDMLLEPVDFAALNEQLYLDLQACRLPDGSYDIEQQMNLLRDVQHQVVFQLLAQDLEGLFTVESLADQLSALADHMLQHTLTRTWQQIRQRYPQAPAEPDFAVIAYGKLGGKELGYASDLDLVFLYRPDERVGTDHYVRLARRMVSWLSALTSSGRLYEVDMRLRPDGDAGLIAVNMDTFVSYQKTKAWTWEHQAITRARFVTGAPGLGRQFELLRQEILSTPRNKVALQEEILNIRLKIEQGHPNSSDLFDIKHDRGGMVDVEFITQFLVLYYSHQHPELIDNLGNTALLAIAAKIRLIPDTLAHPVIESYRFYRRQQHQLRLQGRHFARIDPALAAEHQENVLALWRNIFEN